MPILITRSDGGVSIMYLGLDADENIEVQKWRDFHQGEYVSHRTISLSEIPVDRSKRNAWKSDLTIDAVKSKVIDDDKEDQALNKKVMADLVNAEKAKKK